MKVNFSFISKLNKCTNTRMVLISMLIGITNGNFK